MDDAPAWSEFVGQRVIIDTASPFIYLGTLREVREHFLFLTEVDVHDRNEGPSTKEQYVMDAKRFGINANRKEVSIRKVMVISVSRLDDIITF